MCPIPWIMGPPPPIFTPALPPQDHCISWPPMATEQAQTAFSHQAELEDKIAHLLSAVESGAYGKADLESALSSAQKDVEGLRAYFSDQYRHHPQFYNERRSENSSIADDVFGIPELLELILENLDIPDLLNFYQCNKGIRDKIEESSKLQTQLSLGAAPSDSYLRVPLRNLTRSAKGSEFDCNFNSLFSLVGFSSYEHVGRRKQRTMQYNSELDDRTVEIHACFHLLPGQKLPSMGSRIRDMQILQPPIQEMTVSLDCCPIYEYDPPSHDQKPVRKIFREGGLTVGALYDRTEQLLNEHRFCLEAHSGLLEDNGSVRVGVRFVGSVVVQPDDPVYLKWRDDRKTQKEHDRKYRQKGAKLEAFCNTRKAAYVDGEPIPTIEEFVASHGEDTDWMSLSRPAVFIPSPFFTNPLPPMPLPQMPLPTMQAVSWPVSNSQTTDTAVGSSTKVDAPASDPPGEGIAANSTPTEVSEQAL